MFSALVMMLRSRRLLRFSANCVVVVPESMMMVSLSPTRAAAAMPMRSFLSMFCPCCSVMDWTCWGTERR
ncbi:hypothetical protein D3C72_2214900 [compost metagenome]